MIQLKEFKVTPDDKWLKIKAYVNEDCRHTENDTYNGVYIHNIMLSVTGDFTSQGDKTLYPALSSALHSKGIEHTPDLVEDPTAEISPAIGLTITGTNVTSIDINVGVDSLKKVFYLKMIPVNPLPGSLCTTCAYNNELNEATFNKYNLYKILSCLAHSIVNRACDIPSNFLDFSYRLKALEASIAVMDVDSINDYYNWLINHKCPERQQGTAHSGRCGCHN